MPTQEFLQHLLANEPVAPELVLLLLPRVSLPCCCASAFGAVSRMRCYRRGLRADGIVVTERRRCRFASHFHVAQGGGYRRVSLCLLQASRRWREQDWMFTRQG